MAITFSALTGTKSTVGSIKAWANQATVPSEDILTEAQAWIYQRLRAPEMRSSASWSAGIAESGFALPSDFIAPIKLLLDGGSGDGLLYLHEELFKQRMRDPDGALYTSSWPSVWCINGGMNVMFDVALSEARAGDLEYYARPTALSVSNETNFLVTNFPTLIRRACLMYAYEWLKDWAAHEKLTILSEQALELANQYGDNTRRGQEF